MLKLAGRTALVTGAAGGIGRGIALAPARRGRHLALADMDEAALLQTAAEIEVRNTITRPRVSHRLDVAGRPAVAALPAQVMAAHGAVDLLVNNAGVALGGTFGEIAESDFDWLIGINFWGVVQMTRAFLPLLADSEEARIVNVSSLFGLIAPPGQTAYAASKFAVRGFSEALRHELAGTRVGVTVGASRRHRHLDRQECPHAGKPFRPGGRQARSFFATFLTMPAETAGEIIVAGVERRKARILVGADAKYAALIERLMPVSYWKWLGRRGKT